MIHQSVGRHNRELREIARHNGAPGAIWHAPCIVGPPTARMARLPTYCRDAPPLPSRLDPKEDANAVPHSSTHGVRLDPRGVPSIDPVVPVSTASRRQRRRMRAQMRDLARHGTRERERAPETPARQIRPASIFRMMLPAVPRPQNAITAPIRARTYTVLQDLTARGTGAYTRRKRRIRYRGVSRYRGGRLEW